MFALYKLSISSLLFVRYDVLGHLIQSERYFERITFLAAQEFVYVRRAHHVTQYDRSVVHIVQVADHVLIVHVHLQVS